jgi:hypothetical protein
MADHTLLKTWNRSAETVTARNTTRTDLTQMNKSLTRINNGVSTGDIVSVPSPLPGTKDNKAVIVGFIISHPDSDELRLVWPGDECQKYDGPWPPGGRLTAENISLEVRSAKENFRSHVMRIQRSAESALRSLFGVE